MFPKSWSLKDYNNLEAERYIVIFDGVNLNEGEHNWFVNV